MDQPNHGGCEEASDLEYEDHDLSGERGHTTTVVVCTPCGMRTQGVERAEECASLAPTAESSRNLRPSG